MEISVRQASHPEAVRRFDTEELRRNFLIERIFAPDAIPLTYSHVDRMVIGGAMPVERELRLESATAIGSPGFLDRRELGIVNIGGPGRVTADGETHHLDPRDALYVATGTKDVRFASADAKRPARFYMVSLPAHARMETVRIRLQQARRIDLGAAQNSNERTINQLIHPDICRSCQLVLGLTELKGNSLWNTMPGHTHDRRSEVYFYFGLDPAARVFHFMGEPQETRHIVIANEQAVISPGWSLHSGVGTAPYSFVWAMGGDNQDFADMDMVPVEAMR